GGKLPKDFLGMQTTPQGKNPTTPVPALKASNWEHLALTRLRLDVGARAKGVYLIFADDYRSLLYVGVATVCFDKRVWTHDVDGRMSNGSMRECTDVIVFD